MVSPVNGWRLKKEDQVVCCDSWFCGIFDFFAEVARRPSPPEGAREYHFVILPQLDGALLAAALGFLHERVRQLQYGQTRRSITASELEIGMLVSGYTGAGRVPFTGEVQSLDWGSSNPRGTFLTASSGAGSRGRTTRMVALRSLSDLVVLKPSDVGRPAAWGGAGDTQIVSNSSVLRELIDSESWLSRILLNVRVPDPVYNADVEFNIADPEYPEPVSAVALLRPEGVARNALCRVLKPSAADGENESGLANADTGPACSDSLMVSSDAFLASKSSLERRHLVILSRRDRSIERSVQRILELFAYSQPLEEPVPHLSLPSGSEYICFRGAV